MSGRGFSSRYSTPYLFRKPVLLTHSNHNPVCHSTPESPDTFSGTRSSVREVDHTRYRNPFSVGGVTRSQRDFKLFLRDRRFPRRSDLQDTKTQETRTPHEDTPHHTTPVDHSCPDHSRRRSEPEGGSEGLTLYDSGPDSNVRTVTQVDKWTLLRSPGYSTGPNFGSNSDTFLPFPGRRPSASFRRQSETVLGPVDRSLRR